MKACIYLCLLLPLCRSVAMGQIEWRQDSTAIAVEWNNYSTSFVGDIEKAPLLVVAIPYNGVYGNIDPGANDIHLASPTGLFDFRANEIHHSRVLYTYDSTDVYFLAPGVFRSNGDKYEFRVYMDGGRDIVPWSVVNRFTDSSFYLSTFRRGMGFLGGYRAGWGHYVTAELREADTKKVISLERVLWKETRPAILGVFTAAGLTDFLLGTKGAFDGHVELGNAPRASDTLKPENNELIVFVTEDVYKREALEYRVIRDGKVVRDWGPNDFDDNAVRLKGLVPGAYSLDLRYRRQRQNVKTYRFWKEPYWYQRGWVGWGAVGLVLAFVVLLARLLVLRRQKKLLAEANRKMIMVASELRYIQSQLNPHFIFNALSSIQGLVNKGEIGQANDYLAEFSSLLRETLVGDEKGMAPLAVELKMLRRYLKLEQLRFNFMSEIRVDGRVKENEVSFPVLLLQPLVENAVKHGVAGMEGEGRIEVVIRAEGADMLLEVFDNGKGFAGSGAAAVGDVVGPSGKGGVVVVGPAGRGGGVGQAGDGEGVGFVGSAGGLGQAGDGEVVGPVGEGLGLKLTRERIDLINRSNPGQPVAMRIESRRGKGTVVFLRFKNWLR